MLPMTGFFSFLTLTTRGIDVVREKVKMFAQKKVSLPQGFHKIVLLDEADPIDRSYILEVSSAGLIRELKTDKHLSKFVGSEVEVRLFGALDGTKKLMGKLENFTPEEITLLTEKEIKIPRKDISKIIVDLI